MPSSPKRDARTYFHFPFFGTGPSHHPPHSRSDPVHSQPIWTKAFTEFLIECFRIQTLLLLLRLFLPTFHLPVERKTFPDKSLSIECVDSTTFQTTDRLDKLQIRVMAFHHFVFYYPFPISIVAPPSWLVASKATHKLSQFQVCLSHHLFIIGSHLNSTRMSSSGLGLASSSSSSPPTSIASTPWKHLRILIAFNYYSSALALQLK